MYEFTDEEFEAIADVADRWDITMEEAEYFLARYDYFASIRGGMVR